MVLYVLNQKVPENRDGHLQVSKAQGLGCKELGRPPASPPRPGSRPLCRDPVGLLCPLVAALGSPHSLRSPGSAPQEQTPKFLVIF